MPVSAELLLSPPATSAGDDAAMPAEAAIHPQRIGFVHLGCPKNLVDTETMLGLLERAGHRIVADEQEADTVLVNTCAFIEKAETESVRTLAHLAEGGKRLIISGCLAQKFQGELLDLFPEADAVVGTGNVDEIAGVLNRVAQGERVLAFQQDPTYLLETDAVRRHVTAGAYVYVKIAEGCDYQCGFCIIPSMRGRFRSRSRANIVENVRRLVDEGVREVVLVGQDTTSFGKESGDTLANLLRALNDIDGLDWIRFMYAYPNLVSDDLLDAMAGCQRVVKYLDCPLQHSHPEVLRRMRRPVMDIADFAARIRARVPDVRLRTAFIVGYPGESEAHFAHLLDTVERVRFDRLGVFEYSDVDTAHSHGLTDKVPKKVIQQRRGEVMRRQQPISYAHNMALVGQTLPVLIDSTTPYGALVGRTQWDAPEVDNQVLIKVPAGPATVQAVPGELADVLITGATPYDLKGRLSTACPKEENC
jgi:ribosomal protein S12 methylthiotransferase